MTRALLWKEWREQRPIVIAGLALAIVMPFMLAAGMTSVGRSADLAIVAAAMPLVMWPIIAVACGASTISSEIGDGTLGFLLSRPASRLRVWLVKVAMAWLALLLTMGGTVAVAAVFYGLGPARSGAASPRFTGTSWSGIDLLLVLIGELLLLFACSVFFSTFLSRAMNAAAAGLVTALGIGALMLLAWGRLELIPSFEPALLGLELAAAALLVLVVSLWIFTAGELLSGLRVLRHALFGGMSALGATLVITIPVMMAATRLDPRQAGLQEIGFMPGRNAVVSTAIGEDGGSPQVWLIHLDGSGVERLTGRLAGWPAVSPDGRLVAYVSMRGALGLRADEVSLRVVSTDGGGDRVVVPRLRALTPYVGAPGWGQIQWSPRGDRIALLDRSMALTVAGLDGSSVISRALGRVAPSNSRLVGWSPDGREVLLLSSQWDREGPVRLMAYDPDSQQLREVYRTPGRRIEGKHERIVSNMLPLMLGDRWAFSLVGVHLADGSVQDLLESPCWTGFDLSSDGAMLVYGTCPPQGAPLGPVAIHFRNRQEAAERSTPPLDWRPGEMHVSPSAEWVAVSRFTPEKQPLSVAAVRADGRVTEFDGPWTLLGWTGRSGVVLGESSETGYRRLAVADAATGEVRVVFP